MAVTYGRGSFNAFSETKDTNTDTTDLSDEEIISRNLQKISHNVLQIKNMVNNIGTPLDSEELRHRMSIIQGETHQLTKDTNDALKEVSLTDLPDDNKEQDKLKVKIRLLRENFHDVLKDYHEIQKTAKTKQRQTLKRRLRDSVTQGEESVDNTAGEQREATVMLQIEVVQGELDLELVKEREEALHQLEQDIQDINTIFKDLATMVYDQGEDINVIEDNVDKATEDIEEGVKQLEDAKEYQSSARRKKLFLALIVSAVIVVVVIIVAVVVTQNTSDSNKKTEAPAPTTASPKT